MKPRPSMSMALLLAALQATAHASGAQAIEKALEGQWGGDRMQFTVHQGKGTVDLECARGTVNGPIKLSTKAQFEAKGSFELLRGGPQRVDEVPTPATARYAGTLVGQTLRLEVWPAPGEPVQVFNLRKGVQVKMLRCY